MRRNARAFGNTEMYLRLCTFLPFVRLDFNFIVHNYYKGSEIYQGKNEQVKIRFFFSLEFFFNRIKELKYGAL